VDKLFLLESVPSLIIVGKHLMTRKAISLAFRMHRSSGMLGVGFEGTDFCRETKSFVAVGRVDYGRAFATAGSG
jgi:hypothetical protein